MRTDATIDRRKVLCPNASTTGFGKRYAKRGYLVWYSDGCSRHVGRMIGRIDYAPALSGESTHTRNYLLLGTLSLTLGYGCERWVNPEDVYRTEPVRYQLATMQWFLSDTLSTAPIAEVRTCVSQLWSTFDAFKAGLSTF